MDSPLATVLLPAALAIVMLGLGLSLTVADFARVGRHPKAVVIALLLQLLVLPAICFGLVLAFDLPPILAVGMLLLAASPGGTTANLFSHLFRGDVAAEQMAEQVGGRAARRGGQQQHADGQDRRQVEREHQTEADRRQDEQLQEQGDDHGLGVTTHPGEVGHGEGEPEAQHHDGQGGRQQDGGERRIHGTLRSGGGRPRGPVYQDVPCMVRHRGRVSGLLDTRG